MPKEKHFFVEDDIIARNDLKEIKMQEPKTLKDFEFASIPRYIFIVRALKDEAITHIKHMRREGRDNYYYSIDEKSAIPKLMEIFNLTEEDIGKPKIKNKVEGFL